MATASASDGSEGAQSSAMGGRQRLHITRGARRRFAQETLVAKLAAAHNRIRALELDNIGLIAAGAAPGHGNDSRTDIRIEVDRRLERLDMARPALTSLVISSKTGITVGISGDQRASRNYGLHAGLGCGTDALTAIEAKRCIKGGAKRNLKNASSACDSSENKLAKAETRHGDCEKIASGLST